MTFISCQISCKKKESLGITMVKTRRGESVDLDTMCSMSLKPLSTGASRSQTRCRLANARIDICESDLLFLLGWQAIIILRFLGAMTHLPCERQNFTSRSLRVLSRDLWRSTRYARGVGKDMQKNFKRSTEKYRTSTRCGEIFSRSPTIIFFEIRV